MFNIPVLQAAEQGGSGPTPHTDHAGAPASPPCGSRLAGGAIESANRLVEISDCNHGGGTLGLSESLAKTHSWSRDHGYLSRPTHRSPRPDTLPTICKV